MSPRVRTSSTDIRTAWLGATMASAGITGSPYATPSLNPPSFLVFQARHSCLGSPPHPTITICCPLFSAHRLSCSREASRALNSHPQNMCVFVLDRFWKLVHSRAPETAGWASKGGEGAGRGEGGRSRSPMKLFAANADCALEGRKKGIASSELRLLLISCLSDEPGKAPPHTLTLAWVQKYCDHCTPTTYWPEYPFTGWLSVLWVKCWCPFMMC